MAGTDENNPGDPGKLKLNFGEKWYEQWRPPQANCGLFIAQKSIDTSTPTNLVKQVYILHNDIRDVGYLLKDSGHCFMYISNGDAPGALRNLDDEIACNVLVGLVQVRDNTGGIYLDNGTDFCAIHHNVIDMQLPALDCAGIDRNGAGHFQENLFVYHNTIGGGKPGQRHGAIRSGLNAAKRARRLNLMVRNNLAQSGPVLRFNDWHGKTDRLEVHQSHNRENVPADEFVDAANGNFRLQRWATVSLNAGLVIPGIKDAASGCPYVGGAPDWGAYEHGGIDWTSGSTTTAAHDPPEIPRRDLVPRWEVPDKEVAPLKLGTLAVPAGTQQLRARAAPGIEIQSVCSDRMKKESP